MNQFNNKLTMKDLFMNTELEGVFPQFNENEKLKNVYSFAEVEAKVLKYLSTVLNGTITGEGELRVKGKHKSVLNRVRQLQPLVEGLFNNIPKVLKNLRKNTALYLPYANEKQLIDIKSSFEKTKALKRVLDNFQYNSDFGALNSIKKEEPAKFSRNKKAWEKKVGYRGIKSI